MAAPLLLGIDPRTRASRDRALAKSIQEAQHGNLPIIIRNGTHHVRLSVHSRTRAGTVYLLDYDKTTGQATCDCDAARCWHVLHAERAMLGEIGIILARTGPCVSAADLSGRPG